MRRGELLFLLFPLTIKVAVTLVNLRTKETEENNFECDPGVGGGGGYSLIRA